MPIYEYRCKCCEKKFEELVQAREDAVSCPVCQSQKVGKLISRTSFALKGGGWFKDHYGLKPSAPSPAEGG